MEGGDNVIRILQWGTKRSICKVYDRDEDNDYQLPKLLLIDNESIVDYEELGVFVINADYN